MLTGYKIISMQIELNKFVSISEKNYLFCTKKALSPKKRSLKILYLVRIIEPLSLLPLLTGRLCGHWHHNII